MLERIWTDGDRQLLLNALKALRESRIRAAQSNATPAVSRAVADMGAAVPAAEALAATKLNAVQTPLQPLTAEPASQVIEPRPADSPPSNNNVITFRLVLADEPETGPLSTKAKTPPSDEPVSVVTTETTAKHTEFRLPPPPKPVTKRPAVVLDPRRISQILRDDVSSTQLLADLFSQNEDETSDSEEVTKSAPNAVPDNAERCVAGLDAGHTELLLVLLGRSHWTRAELLAHASRLDLMLDGALERINEVALDLADGVLVEDGADIHLDESVAASLATALNL